MLAKATHWCVAELQKYSESHLPLTVWGSRAQLNTPRTSEGVAVDDVIENDRVV
jgi:hypothetical protein